MRRTRIPLGLLLILGLAAGLRFYGVSDRIYEEDELYTIQDARDFGASSRANGAPGVVARPLYYVLQHALLEVTPETPFYMRLPPILFGVIGVWLTWRLGRSQFGRTAGLVAATLTAVSPWHLTASQTARYWSLVFVWAALAYLLILRAADRDTVRDRLVAAAALLLGALTHPTFLFPMVGVVAAVLLVDRDGGLRDRGGATRDILWLWIPFGLALVGGFLFLRLTDNAGALQNWSGRGLIATLRLVPAMVQWVSVVVFAAGAVSALVLWRGREPCDRRWAAVATLGSTGAIALLLVASLRTNVYADYGMSMLPLLFVTIGGGIQRTTERMASESAGWFPGAATLVLVVASLPGSLSHLSDGTRFDYRPAFHHIERAGADRLVLGWPVAHLEHYAPQLRFRQLLMDASFLEATLDREGGYWLIGSYRRYGLVRDDGAVSDWIARHCRVVLQTERPRIDYRNYRVELHWCGADSPERIKGES